jgi:Uma2 family endonuclease
MVAIITDPEMEQELIERRRAMGVDQFDEVWDGVYVMSPSADNEHQSLATRLANVLGAVIETPGLGTVYAGVNVSDQRRDWRTNYRCPDVAVFLNGTKAVNRRSHWYGGPDFAIEVVSRYDRSLEKLPFYASVGTRELLLIDRDPWSLTLYRLHDGSLADAGRSTGSRSRPLSCEAVPLTWSLKRVRGMSPLIVIGHTDGQQRWTVTGR